MEQFPSFEKQETEEERLRRELVDLLKKEGGLENPNARDLFIAWSEIREVQIDKAADKVLAQIEFERERARVYFEAGYMEEAVIAFNDTLNICKGEGRDKLAQEIMEEIEKLKKGTQ